LVECGYEVRYVPGKGYQAYHKNGNALWLPIPIDVPIDRLINKSLSYEEPIPPPKVRKPRLTKTGWKTRVPKYQHGMWTWEEIYFFDEEKAMEWWDNYKKGR
jgi:hypothetical protein